VRCADIYEGGIWLLDWDALVGGSAVVVWAVTLYLQARETAGASEPISALLYRCAGYAMLGGNMGIATGLLWERDGLVLGN
jgi:hypothetical protein